MIAANVDALAAGRAATATYRPGATPVIVLPLGPRHGAMQLPLGGLVLVRRAAAAIKGRDLLVSRFRATLGQR